MTDLLPFVVVGLASGSVYGLAGMGLVLTYKTTGIFNFAHGAVATAATYLFYALHVQAGLAWPVAVPISIGAVAVAGGLGMERIARGLAETSTAMQIVATVGLLLAVQGLGVVAYGPVARFIDPFLPTRTFTAGGVRIGVDQVIVILVALLAAAGLYAFFRRSRLGVAMRAVVDDPDLLGLAGTSPVAVRAWAWTIGFVFAGASGILLAPGIGLDAFLLTLLVVQAFGAAAIGRFTSLPLTYVGGLAIGVAASLATKFAQDVPLLSGASATLPFLVFFGFVLLTPARQLNLGRLRLPASGILEHELPLSTGARRALAVVGAGLLVLIPALVGAKLPVFTNGLVFVVVFASLHLLVRTSGQVSLCHAAFAAVGAATFSHLAHGIGLPWVAALVGAGLAGAVAGAVIAIPTIRLSGLYLALATFGFGILLERMAYGTGLMFGALGQRRVPRPGVLEMATDTGFYYVVLAVAVAAALVVRAVHRNRLGRLLRGLADSPVALATHGTNVNVTRVVVFCLSSFLAAVAGALFGALTGTISGLGFTWFESLLWLVILAIAGPGRLRAAVVAAVLIAVLPGYLGQADIVTDYGPVAFGATAVAWALAASGRYAPGARLRRAAERATDRAERSPVAERTAALGGAR